MRRTEDETLAHGGRCRAGRVSHRRRCGSRFGSNQQGTGSTITKISPTGQPSVFATISLTSRETYTGGVGLTTALAVFRNGMVVVGSLPTNGANAGTSAGEQAGCLIVLNATGRVVRTISGGPINGPCDLTATQVGDDAVLFCHQCPQWSVTRWHSVWDRPDA
jgi:hypothetical protein